MKHFFLECRKRQRRQEFTPLAGCLPRFRVTQRDVNVPINPSERLANNRKSQKQSSPGVQRGLTASGENNEESI